MAWFLVKDDKVFGRFDGDEETAQRTAVLNSATAVLADFPDMPSVDEVFFADGAVLRKPVRPSQDHWWDETTKQWGPPPLAGVKASRWEEIKAEREVRFYAPITVDGVTVDADRDSVANIMGAIMEMQLTGTATRRWTLHDNTRMDLTLAQLVAIGSAIAERKEVLQNQSQDMRQLIEAAQTSAEVAAVAWP